MFTGRSSLKSRILFLTGGVIILLMLAISFVLLFKWREIIIQKQAENAEAISITFAVTVIDAMIYEEKSIYKKENILETYVDNFITRLGHVRYVVIYDRTGTLIVQRTDRSNYDPTMSIESGVNGTQSREIKIYNNPLFGWTMEVHQPLVFSGKHWGVAKIGYDAQPIRDEINNIFFLLLFATVLLTSIVLAILFISINRMTSSLAKLVHVIDSIDFGSGVKMLLPEQQDEIGYFYRHFMLLQERLENSKKELDHAQKQIYQAEKLASIGRLASGVAHQVNNPLNGIKSCIYAIKQNPRDISKMQEYLDLINEGIENVEVVVKKLLGFARQQSISGHLTSVNEAVRKVVNLFELRLKEKKIDICLELDDSIDNVKIDDHLLQEVVMNLILNSSDAIEQNGSITITTMKNNKTEICLQVRDTGCGIAPSDLKKIFDPFFTTKDVGTGTGLGLSVCMGIIESHGGRIEVRSTQNVETIFSIVLPAGYEN